MADIDLSFSAVTLPANTAATVTVYEDVGNDGSGSSTDPNGKAYDNSAQVSLSDGVTAYTLSGFSGGSGNAYWLELTPIAYDISATSEQVFPVTIDTGAAGSVLVFQAGAIQTTSGNTLQTQ